MYRIGGLFVVQGKLSVGALVAVVAAHKDLTPPWKALVDFWQTYLSAETKFAQIFEGVGMLEPFSPEGWPVTSQRCRLNGALREANGSGVASAVPAGARAGGICGPVEMVRRYALRALMS